MKNLLHDLLDSSPKKVLIKYQMEHLLAQIFEKMQNIYIFCQNWVIPSVPVDVAYTSRRRLNATVEIWSVHSLKCKAERRYNVYVYQTFVCYVGQTSNNSRK